MECACGSVSVQLSMSYFFADWFYATMANNNWLSLPITLCFKPYIYVLMDIDVYKNSQFFSHVRNTCIAFTSEGGYIFKFEGLCSDLL